MCELFDYFSGVSVGDGVDERIKIKRREIRILSLDEDDRGGVVPGEVDVQREGIVEVRKRDPILSPERLTDDDFVDVIKLVPILIPAISELTSDVIMH